MYYDVICLIHEVVVEEILYVHDHVVGNYVRDDAIEMKFNCI